jgi:hypothetical protein
MKNENKIESLKEFIADAKEAFTDPALPDVIKGEIKGQIAEGERQLAAVVAEEAKA